MKGTHLARHTMLVLAGAALCGCVSVPEPFPPEDRPVDEKGFAVLIAALNHSIGSNAAAAKRLVASKRDAVPHLLREVNLADRRRIKGARLDRATRALRVLRAVGADDAIDACRWLLCQGDLGGETTSRCALFTEALAYLADNSRSEAARDAYVAFVMRHSDKYLDLTYVKEHWREGRHIEVVRVDVTSGIRALAKNSDERDKEVMAQMVRIIMKPTYGGSAICRLAPDGFTIQSMRRDPHGLEHLLLRFLNEQDAGQPPLSRLEPGRRRVQPRITRLRASLATARHALIFANEDKLSVKEPPVPCTLPLFAWISVIRG